MPVELQEYNMTLEEMIAFCIERRTSRAISSYITETLFEICFINGVNNITSSTGWYLSYSPTTHNQYIFVAKNILNELDREIVSIVDIPVWQIIQTDGHIVLVSLNNDNVQYEIEEFIASNGLNSRCRRPLNNDQSETDKINNYCQYLHDYNALNHVVDVINLEDVFLNKCFYTTNLDFFVKNELGIMLFEVKFKYPSQNNCYGINLMQAKTLNYFKSKGIYAVNVILNNPNRLDVLEYINEGTYQWLYSNINNIGGIQNAAPNYTNYFNQNEQRHYSIPASHYSSMSRTANIINCRCPVCNSNLTLRNGPYGTFLGCTQFATTDCRGKIKF